MSEWIDVKERLPEPDDANTFPSVKVLVWVAGDTPTCHTAYYSCLIKHWLVQTDYFSTAHGYTVTHWMPLPEPPKMEVQHE